MRAAIDEVLEVLRRFPNAHVDVNPGIFEYADRGCIAGVRLQAPDKALGSLRQCVDLVQPGHETRHERRIEIGYGLGNVDLREIVSSHNDTPNGCRRLPARWR